MRARMYVCLSAKLSFGFFQRFVRTQFFDPPRLPANSPMLPRHAIMVRGVTTDAFHHIIILLNSY